MVKHYETITHKKKDYETIKNIIKHGETLCNYQQLVLL